MKKKCKECEGNGEVLMAKLSEYGVGVLGLKPCPRCHGTGYESTKKVKKGGR